MILSSDHPRRKCLQKTALNGRFLKRHFYAVIRKFFMPLTFYGKKSAYLQPKIWKKSSLSLVKIWGCYALKNKSSHLYKGIFEYIYNQNFESPSLSMAKKQPCDNLWFEKTSLSLPIQGTTYALKNKLFSLFMLKNRYAYNRRIIKNDSRAFRTWIVNLIFNWTHAPFLRGGLENFLRLSM